MKYKITDPIARCQPTGGKRSAEPHRLDSLVEDPRAEKRDMSAEQQAAFHRPGTPDPRVHGNEGDQARKL